MREKILKRLHQILIDIVKAEDSELDKIGAELVEIEKKVMLHGTKNKVYTVEKAKNL